MKLQGRQKHKLHVKQSDCKQVPSGSSNNSSSNSSGSGSGTCNHNGAAAATQVVAAGKGSYYSGNPDNIQKYFLPNLQYEVLELLPKVAHKHTHAHTYTHAYFVYIHTLTTVELLHFIALTKPKRGTQTNGICCSTVAYSLTHSLTHTHTNT